MTAGVATQRVDVFVTMEGLQDLPCVCSPYFHCLYHWYYEVKMNGAPTPGQRKVKIDDQFPGRKPQRDSGRGRAQQHAEVRDPGVRRDGGKDGNRPHHTLRGKGRRR